MHAINAKTQPANFEHSSFQPTNAFLQTSHRMQLPTAIKCGSDTIVFMPLRVLYRVDLVEQNNLSCVDTVSPNPIHGNSQQACSWMGSNRAKGNQVHKFVTALIVIRVSLMVGQMVIIGYL